MGYSPLFFKIILVFTLIYSGDALCGVNSKVLENGLRVIYSDTGSTYPGVVMSVFVRGGAGLSFHKKSAFTSMAQDYASVRIKRLSRNYGFRYRTNISWDYVSYVFYLSPGSMKYSVPKIMSVFFNPEPINLEELNYLKNGVEQKSLWEMNRKAMLYPMVSFFTSRQSVYSAGFNGFLEDALSISDIEFNQFASCYFSTNNVVMSFAGVKEKNVPFDDAKIYKPCFKDESFEEQPFVVSSTPNSDFSYYNAVGTGFVARVGFLSSPCREKSVVYDLITELAKEDDRINSIANSFYTQNNCYSKMGTIEFIFSGASTNFYAGTFIKELSGLTKRLDQASLDKAKENILSSYYSKMYSKEDKSYLLAKAEVTSGNYKELLDYPAILEKIDVTDIKKELKTLVGSTYASVFMKMGK